MGERKDPVDEEDVNALCALNGRFCISRAKVRPSSLTLDLTPSRIDKDLQEMRR